MIDVSNASRASLAQVAVDAFQNCCAVDDSDAVQDLIVNLLHLARRNSGDPHFDVQRYVAARVALHNIEVEEDLEEAA